jgi:hypothetical protein
MASRRAPVRAAIIIRSCIEGLAGPIRSLRTSSSVKSRPAVLIETSETFVPLALGRSSEAAPV